MPFYKLFDTHSEYICTLQGEKGDIEHYYEEHKGKYTLVEIGLISDSDLEEEYDLDLFHLIDEGIDYYLLASDNEYAVKTYKIHCYSQVTKPGDFVITKREFLRCLNENGKLSLVFA
jgi:hypothetical protein